MTIPWTPTPERLKEIEKYAALGLSNIHIAASIGLSETSFYLKKRDYPEIQEALDRGLAKTVAAVAGAMIENAVFNRSERAQEFFLKTKGGFTEKIEKTIKLTHEDSLRDLLEKEESGEKDYDGIAK